MARCARRLREDLLLSHKCIVARNCILTDKLCISLESLPADADSEHRNVLEAKISCQRRLLQQVTRAMALHEASIVQSLAFNKWLTVAVLDCSCITAIAVQAFVNALNSYRSVHDVLPVLNTGFVALYAGEMVLRLCGAGSWRRFFHDPRGDQDSFENRTGILLVVVGACSCIVFWIIQQTGGSNSIWHVLMFIPTFRVLLVHPPFSRLLTSFFYGLSCIGDFVCLLLVVIYIYCNLAFLLFQNLKLTQFETSDHQNFANFSSLSSSILTMMQVMLGTSVTHIK